MKIGYAHVSTEDQRLDLQTQALKRAACSEVFTDHGLSGCSFSRPGLDAALLALKPGNTLVMWRLDRLGRSLVDLVQMIESLGRRDVHFVSLTEAIDTASSGGRLLFHMMAALSEFERNLISERTKAGMDAARRKGQHIGRPPLLSPDDLADAHRAIHEGGQVLEDVADRFNVTARTMRKSLARSGYPA